MTRALAPLYVAAGMVAGLWGGQIAPPDRANEACSGDSVSREAPGPSGRTTPPPRGAQEGGILSGRQRSQPERPVHGDGPLASAALLSQLDALDARIAALAYPDPRHCDDACLTGVERVELRRGVVSCRCRKLPSLGVHKIPEVVQR